MTEQEPSLTILIVDDDPMSVMILTRLLAGAGAAIVTTLSGLDALNLIDRADLAILDISLPDVDGYEIAKRIRANETLVSRPIIFITSHTEPVNKLRAFEVGATDYITKPFDFEEVRARVLGQLHVARRQKEIAERNIELQRQTDSLRLEMAAREQEAALLAASERELLSSRQQLSDSRRRIETIFTALSEVLPGTVLDRRYRLDSLLGVGGFGAVYRATHLVLDRPIAVKVLQPPVGENAERQLESFRTEAVSAYRFDHPNAVSVLDASVSSSGLPYIVMELLEGSSLRQELESLGRLSVKRCAEVIVPVCDVISRAHREGVSHRDIKPDNIFLDLRTGKETVKVLDFGLAKLHRGVGAVIAGSGPRTVVGTPAYMAPEAFLGNESDPEKIDAYAIAVVTFELLAGTLPFSSGTGGLSSLISQHLHSAPPSISTLVPGTPRVIENLVTAGLEKRPEMRPTVAAFAEQLILASLSDSTDGDDGSVATLRLRPLDEP